MSIVYRDCAWPRSPFGELRIPLDVGEAVIPKGVSEEDFELLMGSLRLWKGKVVVKSVERGFDTVVGSYEIKEDSIKFEKDFQTKPVFGVPTASNECTRYDDE